MLDGYSNPTIRFRPKRIVIEKNGKEFDIASLSDGEKCIIATISDLARRLALAYPNMNDPLAGAAVVMIDELELHLHPAWQRMIIRKLPQIFPNCQFIVTTHSPQIISECQPDDVFLLYKTEHGINIEQANQTYGFSTNEILDLIMSDTEDLSNPQSINVKIRRIEDLIDNNQLSEASRQLNTLVQEQKGDSSETIRLKNLIRMQKIQ